MQWKVFSPRVLIILFAVLVCLGLPLPPHADASSDLQAPVQASGSAERIARMEAELKALQEEAARNPSRPTAAQLEQEVKQMIAERNAREARRNQLAWTKGLMTLSLGLNLVLAALLALILARRRRTASTASLAG